VDNKTDAPDVLRNLDKVATRFSDERKYQLAVRENIDKYVKKNGNPPPFELSPSGAEAFLEFLNKENPNMIFLPDNKGMAMPTKYFKEFMAGHLGMGKEVVENIPAPVIANMFAQISGGHSDLDSNGMEVIAYSEDALKGIAATKDKRAWLENSAARV